MRIHTALTSEQITKFVPAGVNIHKFTEHKSRTHTHAFEIQLSGNGRNSRWTNSGTHGAGWVKAASWDEWGIYLGAIFRADKNARVGGTGKYTIYADAFDFMWRTGGRYDEAFTVADQCANHKWSWWCGSGECTKCGAIVRRGREWMS